MRFKPKDLKYKPIDGNWDKDRLKRDIDTYITLQNMNIGYTNGLEDFAKLTTGDKKVFDRAVPEDSERALNFSQTMSAVKRTAYEVEHADKMLGSLEERLVKEAFIYRQEILYPSGDKNYNSVISAVKETNKRRADIQDEEKRAELIQGFIEKFKDDYVRDFWLNFQKSIINDYVAEAVDKSEEKIKGYGANKFAHQHAKIMAELSEKKSEERKKLVEEMRKEGERKIKELGRALNTRETAELGDKFKKRQEELADKYGRVDEDLIKYVGLLENVWYQTNFPSKEKEE